MRLFVAVLAFCLLGMGKSKQFLSGASFLHSKGCHVASDVAAVQGPIETKVIELRGGGVGGGDGEKGVISPGKRTTVRRMIAKRLLGMWGILQVVSIVGNAIRRVLPIAMQPFEEDNLKPFEWALYVTWSFYMIYMEGYKAFQCKFSPLVAKRAFKLVDHASPLNIVFAGPYSMGMMDSTKKRKYISWGVTAGVFGIVKVVKMLPYPYRSIVDAGVVAGLSYGTVSILYFASKAMLGIPIDIDPEFPDKGSHEKSQ